MSVIDTWLKCERQGYATLCSSVQANAGTVQRQVSPPGCMSQASVWSATQVLMPPISGRRIVDFGIGLGRRTTYLYNLPEVASANEYMKVGCTWVDHVC